MPSIWPDFMPEIPRVLDDIDPLLFERTCAEIVRTDNPKLTVRRTDERGDGGIDLIVTGSEQFLRVLGRIVPHENTTFIEIKRRRRNSVDSFSRSVVASLRSSPYTPDAKSFVLVSTAPINLMAQSEIDSICAPEGIGFDYIHRDNILRYLYREPAVSAHLGVAGLLPKIEWPNIVCYWEYGLRKPPLMNPLVRLGREQTIVLQPHERVSVLFTIENFGEDDCEFLAIPERRPDWFYRASVGPRISLQSGSARHGSFDYELIKKGEVAAPTVHIRKELPRDDELFSITASVRGLYVRPVFRQPLIGRSHAKAVGSVKTFIDSISVSTGALMLIYGPAGVGKTRVLEEATQDLTDSHSPILGLTGSSNQPARRFFLGTFYVKPRRSAGHLIAEILRVLGTHSLLNTSQEAQSNAVEALREQGLENCSDLVTDLLRSGIRLPCSVALEDLHYADADLLNLLESLCGEVEGLPILRFCCTGRDDYSYLNPHYSNLLARIRAGYFDSIHTTPLVSLDRREASFFIKSIFRSGITESARKKILALAEGIPFNILQVIEYLTDQSVVEITEAGTYSVKNIHHFNSALGLPDTITQILDLRFRSLPSSSQVLLTGLGLLGGKASLEQFTDFRAAMDIPEDFARTLFSRNLVCSIPGESAIRIIHDNIHQFVETHSSRQVRCRASSVLLKVESIRGPLDSWNEARLLTVAGRQEKAIETADPILGHDTQALSRHPLHLQRWMLEKILEEVDFPIVDGSSAELERLARMYFFLCYSTKFTRNLNFAFETCRRSIAKLDGLCPARASSKSSSFPAYRASLLQMAGHAAQGMGEILTSQDYIQRALALVPPDWSSGEATLPWQDILFDAHDRLRLNYILRDRTEEAWHQYRQAVAVAEQKGDAFLRNIALYGKGDFYLLQEPERCLEIWVENYSEARRVADDRIVLYRELSELFVKLLLGEAEAPAALQQLQDIDRRGRARNYMGLWPKIPHVASLAHWRDGNLDLAIESCLECYEAAETVGYGLYLVVASANASILRCERDSSWFSSRALAARDLKTALLHCEKFRLVEGPLLKRPAAFKTILLANSRRFFQQAGLSDDLVWFDEKLSRRGLDPSALAEVSCSPVFETKFGSLLFSLF